MTTAATDVSSRESVHALVETATKFGDITGLIHAAHVPPSSRCAGGREGAQDRGDSSCRFRQGPSAPIRAARRACIVNLSRLRRCCHEPSPRPLPGVHRRRPCLDARDQGPAWCRHRGAQAGAHGMGQGQSRDGLRPGDVPEGGPAETRNGAARRDHGGGWLLQGVRVRLPAREADASRFDVGGTGWAGEPRRLSLPLNLPINEP